MSCSAACTVHSSGTAVVVVEEKKQRNKKLGVFTLFVLAAVRTCCQLHNPQAMLRTKNFLRDKKLEEKKSITDQSHCSKVLPILLFFFPAIVTLYSCIYISMVVFQAIMHHVCMSGTKGCKSGLCLLF